MKFSTAVYGAPLIGASQVLLHGERKFNSSDPAEKIIASHLDGVNVEDIISADIEEGDSTECLRHMAIVDHKEKALVLAIRGTFALSSTLTDVVAFSEEFCAGQAHAGMAKMARAVWSRAEDAITSKLHELPDDYSLVITGHSLGAGVACLITILVFYEKLLVPREVRCIAYAPPPVFSPAEAAPEAIQHTTAYVHHYDCVPSLSVHSTRRLMHTMVELDEAFQVLPSSERVKVHAGFQPPPDSLVEAVRNARIATLSAKEGAPLLVVPAKCIVWMEDVGDDGQKASYSVSFLDPLLYAKRLLDIHPASLSQHHQTAAYETALSVLTSASKPVVLD